MEENTFAQVVETELVAPLRQLCVLFAEEEDMEAFAFFSNVLFMLSDPEQEAQVLGAVIELSNCAFVGLSFSLEAQEQIDSLLERAIDLSHTMSAPGHMN